MMTKKRHSQGLRKILWKATAPSNIALIKYMGKSDASSNLPVNASLSYTLEDFFTTVTLQQIDAIDDTLEAFEIIHGDYKLLALSHEQISRFLNHLKRIKKIYDFQGSFQVSSANNFPQGVGLASSASSFAALTKCAIIALSEITQKKMLTNSEEANLSRLASGSSCRSFYSPWCLWDNDKVVEIKTFYPKLFHQAIVFDKKAKLISSSSAHARVNTSSDFTGRAERANNRLTMLIPALQTGDWQQIYSICREEFMDMHNLFATSVPSFSYITPECEKLLKKIDTFWQQEKDGPLVTMDAGATVHLLYRQDQERFLNKNLWEIKYDV